MGAYREELQFDSGRESCVPQCCDAREPASSTSETPDPSQVAISASVSSADVVHASIRVTTM